MVITRFLRHRTHGRIYPYHKYLAESIDFEEITPQEAYPEKHIPAKQKGRKTKLKLDTEEVPTPAEPVNEELNADASRGLSA